MRRPLSIALALTAVLAGCSAPTSPAPSTSSTTSTGAAASKTDIDVVGDGIPEHRMDLHMPEHPTGPVPVVIWVHGGGWKVGDKADVMRTDEVQMIATTKAMLEAGYAVAAPNYRLVPNTRFPEPMQDVSAAVRYLRNHAGELGLDPARFALMGDSAGAHLAAMTAMTPHDAELQGSLGEEGDPSVTAFVGYYGIYDLRTRTEDQQAACGRARPGGESSHGQLIGADPDSPTGEPVAAKASPVTHVTSASVPTLLISGRQDCTAPAAQAEGFAAALKKAGVEAHVVLIDKGHGDGQFFTDPAIQKQVLGFLDAHVRN